MDTKDRRDEIISTLSEMKKERQRGHGERVEACQYMKHRIGNGVVEPKDIYDITAIDACETTCHGIAGYLLSPAIRWFKYLVMGENFEKSDDLYGTNDWLEYVMNLQYMLFSNTRFYQISQDAIYDAFIYGTSFESVTDDIENNKVIFDTYDPFECYVQEDTDHRIYKFFREYTMSAEQAMIKWGEACPKEVKRLCDIKAGNTQCKFIHAIIRREDSVKGLASSINKAWGSYHYSYSGDEIFLESGYDSFPLAVHRWSLRNGSPYGLSPCVRYLPEIKKLNELSKQYAIAVQMQTMPPLFAPVELKGKFNYTPGARNYGDVRNGVPTPINVSLNIQYLGQSITEMQIRMQRLLYADLFNVLMRQERQRTAYEVQELKGEGIVLLSAIIGNMQCEKLVPLVMRTFELMDKRGMLPPPPDSIKEAFNNGRVRVELDGPLAQTMKQFHQTQGLTQGLQAIVASVQVWQDSLINFDGDEFVRQYATAMGMPQSVIREKADVLKMKEKEKEMADKQMEQQDMLAKSQALKNMGVDLGQMSQQQSLDAMGGLGGM